MTALAPDLIPLDTEVPVAQARGDAVALRVLAAIDGSARTGRVMKYLLALHARHPAMQVVLLNVQPQPQEWRMRGYGWFHRDEVRDRLVNDVGRRIVASAARHLAAAGIAHEARIELGEPDEVILRCAREERCDLIIVALPEPGPIRKWLMRATRFSICSGASMITHLAPVPVVVAR